MDSASPFLLLSLHSGQHHCVQPFSTSFGLYTYLWFPFASLMHTIDPGLFILTSGDSRRVKVTPHLLSFSYLFISFLFYHLSSRIGTYTYVDPRHLYFDSSSSHTNEVEDVPATGCVITIIIMVTHLTADILLYYFPYISYPYQNTI
ncbi:hypothetical protein EV361DRAFT_942280 [Lentinula raphanica]|nr:hypothetical protein EV361DRAFT_942280 [Lentinula raphanica]